AAAASDHADADGIGIGTPDPECTHGEGSRGSGGGRCRGHELTTRDGHGILTRRKPANGASESHHLLLGIWGSLAFHSGRWAIHASAATPSTASRNEPPRRQPLPSPSVTHSAALQCRSKTPSRSAERLASGWVVPLAFSITPARGAIASPGAKARSCTRCHCAAVGTV